MKYKHYHPYIAPHFFIQNGQKYLIPGWIPVPMDTVYNDVEWIRSESPVQHETESEKKDLDIQD